MSRLNKLSVDCIRSADAIQLYQVSPSDDSTWWIRYGEFSKLDSVLRFYTCAAGDGAPMRYPDFLSARRAAMRIRPDLLSSDFYVSLAFDRQS